VGTIRDVRRVLVAASRRHSRVSHEAEDVAHDIIVAALRRGLALEDDRFARTADASARQHGAFVARSAARRRARELLCAAEPEGTDADGPNDGSLNGGSLNDGAGVPSTGLPSALEITLLLLSLGHTKSELCSALGITDAALRKRLQGLRERAPLARPRFAERSAGSPSLRRTQVGLLPELAPRLEGCRGSGRLIAVSDGDGHGIIFSEVLTNARGTATANARAPDFRGNEAPVKGKPC
jgi:DNA-directed RNA polymerase specialized sigma24 family protein